MAEEEESFHNEVVAQYLQAQKAAVLEIADQGLVSLAQLVETGAIDVSPRFQRRDRWNPTKQSLLIESFLANIPVPPVYLAEDESQLGSYAVIDGKQRLTAIALFFSNQLPLRGLTRFEKLNGLTLAGLPEEIRRSLGMKNLRITTLLRQSNEELKHEVFIRLNTGGEVLNAQEIRNVAYRGVLNNLVFELAENRFLRSQFKIVPPDSPGYQQMTDAELVLRFLALSDGWREFRGALREELDRFMMANRSATPAQLKRWKTRFDTSISVAEQIWGEDAFKRPGRDQALSGLYDAQMLALAEMPKSQVHSLVERRPAIRRATLKLMDSRRFADERGVRVPGA